MTGRHTVIGADGFIGSHLADSLERDGAAVSRVGRDKPTPAGSLGTVYYCAGVTADFRIRPRDTVTAHVCDLMDLLWQGHYEALVYCSSTRVYEGAASGTEESRLVVNPNEPGNLYNLSKILGEAACLAAPGDRARIVRMSNVVGSDAGSDNFIFALAREAVTTKTIRLLQPSGASRDYVAIDDVTTLLPAVAGGRHRIYNVASGRPRTNLEVARAVAALARCEVEFEASEPAPRFPVIDVSRVREEFGFEPADALAYLPLVIDGFRQPR